MCIQITGNRPATTAKLHVGAPTANPPLGTKLQHDAKGLSYWKPQFQDSSDAQDFGTFIRFFAANAMEATISAAARLSRPRKIKFVSEKRLRISGQRKGG